MMKEFFRDCTCGHRETQHKIVFKSRGSIHERTKCRVCDCKKFVLKKEKEGSASEKVVKE